MIKRTSYTRLIFCATILIFLVLAACDDNNTGLPNPTPAPTPTASPSPVPTPPPGCLDASRNSTILEDNSECPAAVLVQMCNSFICNIENISDQSTEEILFQSFTCEAFDCFNFTCAVRDFDNSVDIIGSGEFNIEIVEGNSIDGSGIITDDAQNTIEFNYSCSPLIE